MKVKVIIKNILGKTLEEHTLTCPGLIATKTLGMQYVQASNKEEVFQNGDYLMIVKPVIERG